MAQTQSQLPSQSFSPSNIPSPSPNPPSPATAVGGAPPAKRPRLSPLPQGQAQPPPPTAFSSPGFGTLQLPPKTASPVNGAPINGMPNLNPLPPPPPGSMAPPPARPVEKAPDAAELTDVLAGSGIDVREEEAYLTQGYRSTATAPPAPPPRLQTTFNTSFASQPSAGTVSAGASFNNLTPTQQSSFHPYSHVASQAPLPPRPAQKTPEQVAADERHQQNTTASRRAQFHLQAPFLETAVIETHLSRLTDDVGVKLPTQGVYRPVPDSRPMTVEVTGPDGSTAVTTGRTLMEHNATLGDIIALISLACEERLRNVVENSAALAHNRRNHSHGIVPDEWTPLAATPDTTTANKSTTVNSGASPAGNPRKRSLSAEPVRATTPLLVKGNMLVDKDSTYEGDRAAKRARRAPEAVVPAGDGRAGATPTPGTSTPIGERAPEPERKISKKELKKAESKITDAVQHQQAVATARMATGNLGGSMFGKKKKYSWLTAAAGPAPRPGISTPATPGTAAPAGTPTAGGATATTTTKPQGARLGQWREDDKRAAGIHLKDVLFSLEVDGVAAKHVQKGYCKQSKEETNPPAR